MGTHGLCKKSWLRIQAFLWIVTPAVHSLFTMKTLLMGAQNSLQNMSASHCDQHPALCPQFTRGGLTHLTLSVVPVGQDQSELPAKIPRLVGRSNTRFQFVPLTLAIVV